MSQSIQTLQFITKKENINSAEKQDKDLMKFIDISKGKILTLLKTVFSFLNDNTLLKNDSFSSFEKYLIDNKFIQTMTRIFYFYTANYENGKIILHELIKERYLKFIKYYEQNINYFSNTKELLYRYLQIQGLILLWLIETKYETEYYDELIRLINSLKKLDENNNDINDDNKYLNKFLNIIIKFPFIKQNKEIILKVLEANECNNSTISNFNNNLNNYVQKKYSNFKQNLFDEDSSKIIGKKKIESENKEYFSLIKENSIFSHKRKSYSNVNSFKGIFSSINSSGFYTPEFKHNKRDSIKHFRRFTINNINNPKTLILKNSNYSNTNSLSDGMNNLLVKCEEAKNKSNSISSSILNNNKNCPISTKSKLRLAVQGHFYTEDDYKNNIDMIKCNSSKTSLNELNNGNIISNDINGIKNDIICENDICDNYNENEIENNIVSVDELPINTNRSIMSSTNSKNLGVEPENIIQETREEEEIDENEQIKDKKDNNSTNNDNTYVKILTDNEIKEFFSQQFSDNKNNKKNPINNNIKNNINEVNIENKKKKKLINKNKRRNNSSNSSNNSSRNNSLNNNLLNKSQKNVIIMNKNRENSKNKISINNNNLIKNKSKSKEKKIITAKDKMAKMKSCQNIFGMIKSHKNNKKENNLLKNKNENIILEPCTKGKDLMNNILSQHNNRKENNISKERLPTDSVAKKNLLSLYNQMKAKK